jgi:hypothetical protein
MKKLLLVLALCAFTATSFAQIDSATVVKNNNGAKPTHTIMDLIPFFPSIKMDTKDLFVGSFGIFINPGFAPLKRKVGDTTKFYLMTNEVRALVKIAHPGFPGVNYDTAHIYGIKSLSMADLHAYFIGFNPTKEQEDGEWITMDKDPGYEYFKYKQAIALSIDMKSKVTTNTKPIVIWQLTPLKKEQLASN